MAKIALNIYNLLLFASTKNKLKPNTSVLWVFLLVFALVLASGCIGEREQLEIDLNKTQEGVVQFPQDDANAVHFGFDRPLKVKEDARIYAPFLQYLSEETGRTFKTHFTSKDETTQDNLGEGITQFAALDALSYLRAHDDYGVICIAQGLNAEGRDEYRTAIVTCPDSDITELKEIRSRTFCLGSFYSTQGHLILRKMLEDANITLSDLGHYEYTDSCIECAMAVIAGDFDAGGIQDTRANVLANEGKLKIVAFSDYYPSTRISANKDVDPALLEDVKKALLDFDPKGKHAGNLTDWDKTAMPCGFVAAEDSDYTGLRKLAMRYGVIKEDVME